MLISFGSIARTVFITHIQTVEMNDTGYKIQFKNKNMETLRLL